MNWYYIRTNTTYLYLVPYFMYVRLACRAASIFGGDPYLIELLDPAEDLENEATASGVSSKKLRLYIHVETRSILNGPMYLRTDRLCASAFAAKGKKGGGAGEREHGGSKRLA